MLDMPDSYRGVHRGDNNDPAISDAYAADAIKLMDDAVSKGREVSATMDNKGLWVMCVHNIITRILIARYLYIKLDRYH